MLKCISKYKSSLGSFVPGDLVDDLRLEVSLLLDSSGSFEVVEKQVEEPVILVPAVLEESSRVIRKRRLIED